MLPRRHRTRSRNPCRYLNRRLQIVASLTLFLLLSIILLGSSSPSNPYLSHIPYSAQLKQHTDTVVEHLSSLHKDVREHVNTAQWLNRLDPFTTPAHAVPADQPDSHVGDVSWFSDLGTWMNPFSRATTQDERAVLPPLEPRPPVYTYFDPAGRHVDERSKKVELELLEIWRRAWWAQGFKPVVLSRSEAMNNVDYPLVEKLDLEPEMELEMRRWLAWGNMGSGILCNWLAVPMAPFDDPLLAFLRRGEYASLMRFEELESGLFVGTKDGVHKAIQAAIQSSVVDTAKSMLQVARDLFEVEDNHAGIAFYSTKKIKETYTPIGDKLEHEDTRAEGLAMLPPLINSHLQMTWQNQFSKGIAVLKPLAQNTTWMIEPAIDIARNLSTCPASPMQSSCPPNNPKCSPCVSKTPMTISTPPIYRNTTSLFTIGTVPHPYTLQSLLHNRDALDIPFLRRNTKRDIWLTATTKELLGTGISSFARLGDFKDAVASSHGSARSLWLTAEDPIYLRTERDMREMDWIFGFAIPRAPLRDGKSETPVPGPERRPPPPKQEFDGPKPTEKQLRRQRDIGEKTKNVIKKGERRSGEREAVAVRSAVEAWNLADTEAWKFVRAFNARRLVERQKWQKEEEAYLGKGLVDRWKDTLGGR